MAPRATKATTVGKISVGSGPGVMAEYDISVMLAAGSEAHAKAGTGVKAIVSLTQAQYNALTPDEETLYVITDA